MFFRLSNISRVRRIYVQIREYLALRRVEMPYERGEAVMRREVRQKIAQVLIYV